MRIETPVVTTEILLLEQAQGEIALIREATIAHNLNVVSKNQVWPASVSVLILATPEGEEYGVQENSLGDDRLLQSARKRFSGV